MTENEAILIMNGSTREEHLYMYDAEDRPYLIARAENMALKALEEIQEYRAIGTVEGYKRAIAVSKENYYLCAEYKAKLKQYRTIGTIKEFKAFKEKAEPKKPRFYAHNYYCTECGNLVGNNEFEWQRFLYCDNCGQKLDWSK